MLNHRCPACPFNDGITIEATQAQNWGCLPTKDYMKMTLQDRGLALSCHDTQSTACKGLSEVCDTSKARVWSYSNWYKGEQA